MLPRKTKVLLTKCLIVCLWSKQRADKALRTSLRQKLVEKWASCEALVTMQTLHLVTQFFYLTTWLPTSYGPLETSPQSTPGLAADGECWDPPLIPGGESRCCARCWSPGPTAASIHLKCRTGQPLRCTPTSPGATAIYLKLSRAQTKRLTSVWTFSSVTLWRRASSWQRGWDFPSGVFFRPLRFPPLDRLLKIGRSTLIHSL